MEELKNSLTNTQDLLDRIGGLKLLENDVKSHGGLLREHIVSFEQLTGDDTFSESLESYSSSTPITLNLTDYSTNLTTCRENLHDKLKDSIDELKNRLLDFRLDVLNVIIAYEESISDKLVGITPKFNSDELGVSTYDAAKDRDVVKSIYEVSPFSYYLLLDKESVGTFEELVLKYKNRNLLMMFLNKVITRDTDFDNISMLGQYKDLDAHNKPTYMELLISAKSNSFKYFIYSLRDYIDGLWADLDTIAKTDFSIISYTGVEKEKLKLLAFNQNMLMTLIYEEFTDENFVRDLEAIYTVLELMAKLIEKS